MEIPGQGSLGMLVSDALDLTGQVRPGPVVQPGGGKRNAAEQAALEKSAREFEGVFLNTLMKAMRRTVPTNDLFNGGGATKFYRQMHDAEIAKTLATGHSGMGIADMIVRQLSRPGTGDQPVQERVDPALQGPPAPRVLARYRDVVSLGPAGQSRKRLTELATRQGKAVADTLAKFEREIQDAAAASGLDPALILSVVMEESGGDPAALSERGAQGLMQLMPGTAREMGVEDPGNPARNLAGGARYLAEMMEKFGGRLEVALAAYNAGPGTVESRGGEIPPYPETRRYIDRVLERYEQLGGGTHLASPDR